MIDWVIALALTFIGISVVLRVIAETWFNNAKMYQPDSSMYTGLKLASGLFSIITVVGLSILILVLSWVRVFT